MKRNVIMNYIVMQLFHTDYTAFNNKNEQNRVYSSARTFVRLLLPCLHSTGGQLIPPNEAVRQKPLLVGQVSHYAPEMQILCRVTQL